MVQLEPVTVQQDSRQPVDRALNLTALLGGRLHSFSGASTFIKSVNSLKGLQNWNKIDLIVTFLLLAWIPSNPQWNL